MSTSAEQYIYVPRSGPPSKAGCGFSGCMLLLLLLIGPTFMTESYRRAILLPSDSTTLDVDAGRSSDVMCVGHKTVKPLFVRHSLVCQNASRKIRVLQRVPIAASAKTADSSMPSSADVSER